MRFAVACTLAAIGCSTGSGVDIQVKPPAGTVHVELLVAPGDCTDAACSGGIAWVTGGPQAAGQIFDVDSEKRNMLGVPASGTVRFQLHASNDHAIDRIAVIAFDGNDRALALKVLEQLVVPTDHAEIWQVELEAINDISDAPDAPPAAGAPTERQHVWRPPVVAGGPEDPASYPSCLVTQKWDDTAKQWNREFVVPADRDCDNQPIECNPFWYEFAVGQAASVCASNTSGTDAPACLVGGSLCADGRSDSSACTVDASHPLLCVPDAVCQCTDPGMFATCVRDELAIGFATPLQSPITYADCEFPAIAGTPGPCQSNSANLLKINMPPNCTAVALYRFAVPGAMLVATNNASFTINGVSYQMQVALGDGGGCPVGLVWQSGAQLTTPTPLMLDVSYGTSTHLLMPVKVAFTPSPTCPPPVQRPDCPLLGPGSADHMFTCTQ